MATKLGILIASVLFIGPAGGVIIAMGGKIEHVGTDEHVMHFAATGRGVALTTYVPHIYDQGDFR